MFELKGKNGKAMIYADIFDDATISQIMMLLNSPLAKNSKIRIMADCHAGKGAVVGTTMTIVDKVCPSLVGMDIGCGMTCVCLGKLDINQKFLEELDKACYFVPHGFSVHEHIPNHLWNIAKKELKCKTGREFIDSLHAKDYLKDITKVLCALGSLGGGNHFIELDKDEEDTIYLVVHSGSRTLGKEIGESYQRLALKNVSEEISDYRKKLDGLKNKVEYDKLRTEFLDKFSDLPKDLYYLEKEALKNYLDDTKQVQKFASLNRKLIVYQILNYLFKEEFNIVKNKYTSSNYSFEYFETIHNYIEPEANILRKGSIRALKDEMVLIPMNMRDGTLLCRGLGNPEYNYSAPHGAGRLLSRADAKESISLEEYKNTMKNIYTTSVSSTTLDESPFAYKPVEAILNNIKDTVEVMHILKPLYNFKAS